MTSRLNLCATLQVDLARLRLFNARAGADLRRITAAEASSILKAHGVILERLQTVRPGGTIVFPELLRALIDALEAFPLRSLFDLVGVASVEAKCASVQRGLESRKEFAEQCANHDVAPVLAELAEYLLSTVGRRPDMAVGFWDRLSHKFRDVEDQKALLRGIQQWVKETEHLQTQPVTVLAQRLILCCPALRSGWEMLKDLVARLDTMVYVPLVFNDNQLGLAAPVEIIADYSSPSASPVVEWLGEPTENDNPQPKPAFVDAIREASRMAHQMLVARGRRPTNPEIGVTIRLPDLRFGTSGPMKYNQRSLELGTALALFCQHPEGRRFGITLNPEIMPTGPIEKEALAAKHLAFQTVGELQTLLVSTEQTLETRPARTWIKPHKDHNGLVNAYVTPGGWRALDWNLAPVLCFGEGNRWDDPLCEARRHASNPPPLIAMRDWQEQKLSTLLSKEHAVQVEGAPGIGKSWLIAQWLERNHRGYDLVLYTSPPDIAGYNLQSWAQGALTSLADQLERRWGIPAVREAFRGHQELWLRPDEVATVVVNALGGKRVLWVIENGQAFLTADGELLSDAARNFRMSDMLVPALVREVHRQDNQELLFVTNRRLERPLSLASYLMDKVEGFAFSELEAIQYLERAHWPHPQFARLVAKTLSQHPRALALLVGHATGYHLSTSELFDIIKSLNVGSDPMELRQSVGAKILQPFLKSLDEQRPAAWHALQLCSTFIQPFDLNRYKRLTEMPNMQGGRPRDDLDHLTARHLLHWAGGHWWTDTFVRGYVQDLLSSKDPQRYRAAHVYAGRTYFPLDRSGQIYRNPDQRQRDAYNDVGACAAALYHFQKGDYQAGQRAVVNNTYGEFVPKAKWLLQCGSPERAEQLLAKVLEVYAARDVEDPSGITAASADLNYMMGAALRLQKKKDKYDRATLHYRAALASGAVNALADLIIVLCDLSPVGDDASPTWKEAESLFNALSKRVIAGQVEPSSAIGEAYEKIAEHYAALTPGDITLPMMVSEEARNAGLPWDGIYLIGGRLLGSQGEIEGAAEWFTTGLKEHPRSARLFEAHCVLRAEHPKLPRLPLELRRTDRGSAFYMLIALKLKNGGFRDAALSVLADATQIYPDVSDLWQHFVKLAEDPKRIRRTIRLYLRAIQKFPKHPELYSSLGTFLRLMGRAAAAERAFRMGLAANPESQNMCFQVALFYCLQARYDEAETLLTSFGGKKSIAYYSVWIRLLMDTGRHDEAIRTIEQTGRMDSGFDQLLAACFIAKGQLAEAETIYKKLIEDRPGYPVGYGRLGTLLESSGRIGEAREVYRAGVSVLPRSPGLVGRLSVLEYRVGHKELALRMLKEYGDASPQIFMTMGRIYQAEQSFDDARTCYEKAVPLDTFGFARLYLGEVYEAQAAKSASQGAEDKATILRLQAKMAYKQGTEQLPGNYGCFLRLGEMLRKEGDYVGAENLFRRAVAADARESSLWIALGEVLSRSNGGPRNTLTVSAQANIYHDLATVREEVGDIDGTASLYKEALDEFPSDGVLHLMFGQFLERHGRSREAEKVYRSGIKAAPRQAELHLALGLLLRKPKTLVEDTLLLSYKPDTAVGDDDADIVHDSMAAAVETLS